VSNGYAIGHAHVNIEKKIEVVVKAISNTASEIDRFKAALELSGEQLIEIKQLTEKNIGAKDAEIFEAHLMILNDPHLLDETCKCIESYNINAEAALVRVMGTFIQLFDEIEDVYIKERAADIRDVEKRILMNLSKDGIHIIESDFEDTIIVAHDLTPSDTAQLDSSKVIGFITEIGGKTSHTAIMAKSLEIPAIVGIKNITKEIKTGDILIIDGFSGAVIINPHSETVEIYKKKIEEYKVVKSELAQYKSRHVFTKDNKRIEIFGNIGTPKNVNKVLDNGGEGIGLFRTEFLYMDRENFPDENEQFEAYKSVTEKMADKPVIIRTLDIGGDKHLSYFEIPNEMNPFLGYRAIRLCLDRTDIFKVQLRGILRASNHGNIRIMFPMIASLEELLKAKALLLVCMAELEAEGLPFNKNIEVGIMIEIPAAALCAEELAKHVDFFSIGTNDLIQYTLAADRMNEKVSYLYDPKHPAIIKLIKMTVDAAHKENKICGICGEMAGDPSLIPILIELGVDELSMSAASILEAKKAIVSLTE
jgi:phosphotransferase system enzyme I (PtsI)